jgi:hypothetical protein
MILLAIVLILISIQLVLLTRVVTKLVKDVDFLTVVSLGGTMLNVLKDKNFLKDLKKKASKKK